MTKLIFDNQETEIPDDEILKDIFDIDFGGVLVQFTKQDNGKIIATNGMNGYGENIRDEIYGKEATIK